MKKPITPLAGILVVSVLSACNDEIERKAVSIGIANQPSSALLHIAMAQGFFDDFALDVEAKYYVSGKRALLDGFDTGVVQYFAASDAPFVSRSFEDENLVLLAKVYTNDNLNRIVGRKDHGVETLADLSGKHIATQSRSAVHFFLHSVLLDYDIAHSDVTFSYFPGQELPQKLIDGDIDAFSMREPFVSQAVDVLGDNATVLEAPGSYIQSDVLVTSRETIEADPEVGQRLMQGLLKAQEFAEQNEDQAIQIVSDAIDSDPEEVSKIWDTFDLDVGLDQSLLLQLSRVADWVAEEVKPVADKPNPLDHIYADALKSVRPERVTIIGK